MLFQFPTNRHSHDSPRWRAASQLLLVAAMFAVPAIETEAAIVFDFKNNGAAFDDVGAGVTMSADDGATTIIMTSLDIRAPEYKKTGSVWAATGNTLSAASVNRVQTNTSENSLGINNLSLSNTEFGLAGGGTTAGGESANFNLDESWVVDFDTTLRIDQFNFSSIDEGDFFRVEIEGVVTTYEFGDGNANDDFSDPFSGLIIPAGSDITFTAGGSLATTDIRITEISVSAIPEPASTIALLSVFGMVVLRRRRNPIA